MKVEIFALCDAATDYGGKLNILGAYDTISSPSLPTNGPALVFAARIRFQDEEQGKRCCDLAVVDYDGRAVMPPFKAHITATIPPERDSGAVNFILTIVGASFKLAGHYRADLLMDGAVVASLPLDVVLRNSST